MFRFNHHPIPQEFSQPRVVTIIHLTEIFMLYIQIGQIPIDLSGGCIITFDPFKMPANNLLYFALPGSNPSSMACCKSR